MTQQVHVVQRGENLFRIALRYDRTVEELAQANGISPPYIIHAGNEITIPARGGVAQTPTQAPQTTTASEETHCYIVGDVCFLDFYDCGDGRTWESQRAWKRGWCMAAIYAGVIEGTAQQCVDSNARTVAERVLISSLNGMTVIWQTPAVPGSAVQRERRRQGSSSNGGGRDQQQDQQQPQLVLHKELPPQDKLPKIPDQQGQEELLLQILLKQEPEHQGLQQTQYQQLQGPQGEQGGGHPSDSYPLCGTIQKPVSYHDRELTRPVYQTPCIDPNPPDRRVDKSSTVSGEGDVKKPNYIPRVPASGSCRGEGSNCHNCGWQMEQIYGDKSRTETHRRCKVKGEDPCTAYEEVTINIAHEPDQTTWRYVCR